MASRGLLAHLKTPVYLGASTGKKPNVEEKTFADPDGFISEILQDEPEQFVKVEHQSENVAEGVVDLVSESESSSDTDSFNSDFEDSDVDGPGSASVGEEPPFPPAKRVRISLELAGDDAFVKNKRSKIIHRILGAGDRVTHSVYANGELMKESFTACGRSTQTNYEVVHEISDWTSRCRVCFCGRRAPALEE